jgi:hypothetical protein
MHRVDSLGGRRGWSTDNGQWASRASPQSVRTGVSVPNAYSVHYAWDPNTLAGTIRETANVAECGNPAGSKFTDNFQLRQAS